MKKLTALLVVAITLGLAVVACKKQAPAADVTVTADVTTDATADATADVQ